MTPMTKSSPFLLLMATILLLLAALVAFWMTLLPQRMLSQLAQHLASEQGLVLEARHPRIRFDGGMLLQLEGVTLSNADNTTSLTAQDLSLDAGFATVFGRAVTADVLTLTAPVLTLDISIGAKPLMLPARQVFIREGTVRLRDATRRSAIAFSDVNGSLTLAETATLDVSFMQNGALTRVTAEAESVERLMALGSPADILVSAKDNLLSFSGRVRFKDGLALDGQMTLEGRDAAQTLRWIGMPINGVDGAVAVTAGLASEGLSANFSNLSAKIGSAEFKGLANLQAGPDRAKFTGDLSATRLAVLSKTTGLSRPWRDMPFDTRDLIAIDTDVKVKADQLVLRGHELGAADLTLSMAGGNTSLGVMLPAGGLNVALGLDGRVVTLKADMDIKAIDAKMLLGGLFGFDQLSGLADVILKVSGTGESPAAWISTLRGGFSFTSKASTISDVDLAALLAEPQEGWKSGGKTVTRDLGLVIDGDLAEGVATLTKAEIILPGGTFKAKGEVDLLRQAFDLVLLPKGKVQAVKGTWAKPLFAADAGIAPPLRPVTAPAN